MNPSASPRRRPGVLILTDLQSPAAAAVLQDTRLRLLAVLASQECHRKDGFSIQGLAARLACTPQNVHHHVRALDAVGVLQVTRSEPTQRIPRQFWVSQVREVRLRPYPGVELTLDLGHPRQAESRAAELVTTWTKQHGHVPLAPHLHAVSSWLVAMEAQAARDLVRRLSALAAHATDRGQDG